MAILSGGSTWFSPQKMAIGESRTGVFVSYEQDVPPSNPRYQPQDVLTMEFDPGVQTKIGANASLKQTMRAHASRLEPGALLKLTNRGPKQSKSGFSFTHIEVDLVEDPSFPPAAGKVVLFAGAPRQGDDDAEMEKRLAEARARRAA